MKMGLMTPLAVLLLMVAPDLAAADCQARGSVQFLCGPVSPEDLAIVPASDLLIASGMEDEGYLYLVDSEALSSVALYPTADARHRHDRGRFASCPGPLQSGFAPHGIYLKPGPDNLHTLYVVRHGAREAIEVFELEPAADPPALTWIGCVPAPDTVVFNSVVGLPDGGIAATQFRLEDGVVWEWQQTTGWQQVPGSQTNGPNGIEVSADGRWFYLGGWASRSLIRLSRGRDPVQVDAVPVSHHIDNVRWAPDGTLLAAGHVGPASDSVFNCLRQGQCEGIESRVSRVDPEAMTAREILSHPTDSDLILATVAVEVGNEIWVGGIAGSDRIARFQRPAD